MKAVFSISPYPTKTKSYSYNHAYKILANFFDENVCQFYGKNILTDDIKTDYYIIIDNIGENLNNIKFLKKLKSQGTKIVLILYDPPGHQSADILIAENLIDLIITFDKRWSGRFKTNHYITDYIFNKNLFPTDNPTEYQNLICIYGQLQGIGRENKYNLPKIDNNISSYPELYQKIQEYNGAHVLTPGMAEDHKTLIHYNKAKPIEILLCGRNPYCEEGLDYLNYNKYLKTASQISQPVPIDFDRNEIFQINDENVANFKKAIFNEI